MTASVEVKVLSWAGNDVRNEILHREPRGHSPLSSGGCDCLSGNGPEIALFEYPNLKGLPKRYTLLTFMESVFRLYSGETRTKPIICFRKTVYSSLIQKGERRRNSCGSFYGCRSVMIRRT
ncbi:hypothetical protein Trydic_g9630 [Trypoxylus dichotomus]